MRPGRQALRLGELEDARRQPFGLLDELGRRILGGLPSRQRLLVALLLEGIEQTLRGDGLGLGDRLVGLVAPLLALLSPD